jgi:hypothetical protein
MTSVRNWLPLAVLAVCIGSFATPEPARAQTISGYDWNDPVTLRLRDGRKLDGRYRGVLGAPDSDTPYADRYAAWRSDMAPATSPALGEMLDVALKSGDTVSGTFHGFADTAVLLGTADSCILVVLPFKQIRDLRREHGTQDDPGWSAAKKRWKSAPSLCVIAVQSEGLTQGVPVSMVVGQAPKHASRGDHVARAALAVVVGAAILGLAMTAAVASTFSHALI